MKYRVVGNLHRGSRVYRTGDVVELDEKEGAQLLACGAVEPFTKPFGEFHRRGAADVQVEDGELNALLTSIQLATDSVVAKIRDADERIAKLEAERTLLTEAPVSRADFMAYVRSDIERRADAFKSNLASWQRKWFRNTFTQWEGAEESGRPQPIPYLDGENTLACAMSGPAIYWMFGEQIAARFSAAIEALPFPDDAVPVEERRLRIASIDEEIAGLVMSRDALADQLSAVLGER